MPFMPVEVHFKPVNDGRWKGWIASCPSLDIVTQGEDFERAQANLQEALALFVESCLKRGTLEQVLKEAGYSPVEMNTVSQAAKEYLHTQVLSPSERECRA